MFAPQAADFRAGKGGDIESADTNPMLRLVIDPRMDQLGCQVRATVFGRETHRVAPRGRIRCRKKFLAERLIDHGRYGKDGCAPMLLRLRIDHILNAVA